MSNLLPHNDALPNEHLAEVFRLAMGNPVSRSKTRARISCVCKKWRTVLFTSKFLWSTIVLEIEDQDRYGRSKLVMTDTSNLTQCLALSHPHPLDITLCVDNHTSKHDYDLVEIMINAVTLLRAHYLRWRSFSCQGPAWVFDLPAIESTVEELRLLRRLENLDLVLIPEIAATVRHSYLGDIPRIASNEYMVPQSLRSLHITFPFPHMNATWMNVTSFVGGFDSHQHLYEVLSHMDTLEILHLTHLRALTVAPKRSITLSSLRHLKLSHCAIVELSPMAAYFRVPVLEALSLVDDLHIHHFTRSCDEGRDLTAAMADELFNMLEQSRVAIHELNVELLGVSVESPFHKRLFTVLSETVRTLRISSSISSGALELEAFLNQLNYEDNARVLFPMLHELQVVGNNQNDNLFCGPAFNALERLVISRWEAGDQANFPRLQKLCLKRTGTLVEFDEERDISPLVGSSLALALLKYRLEGLDVQLLDGFSSSSEDWFVDILDRTRSYMPAVL